MRYLTVCDMRVLRGQLRSRTSLAREQTRTQECERLPRVGRATPTTASTGDDALVSFAARTRETFRRAFHGTRSWSNANSASSSYNGRRDVSAEDLLIDLAAIDPVTTSLLVVRHNPTATK